MLPDEKWINGYRSDIEVETGMNRASQKASNKERESTNGESRFLRTTVCRQLSHKQRTVKLKLARKIHGEWRSKKNSEGLYEVLAPGSQILKVSPTTSTIKEPRKPIVTMRNSDIAKFGSLQAREKEIPLKVYAAVEGHELAQNWWSNRSKATLNSSKGKSEGTKR